MTRWSCRTRVPAQNAVAAYFAHSRLFCMHTRAAIRPLSSKSPTADRAKSPRRLGLMRAPRRLSDHESQSGAAVVLHKRVPGQELLQMIKFSAAAV